MTRRRLVAAAAAGLVLVPAGAHATTTEGPSIPDIPAQNLEQSVLDLQLEVHDLELNVEDFESTAVSSGSSTAVALNSDVLFGFDESTLSSSADGAIRDVVKDVPRGATVEITGYTDSTGEDAYNKKLSTDRAKAVETSVKKARPDLKITSTGKGATNPVEPNEEGGEDNPEGRAKNRRVEISWTK